MIGIGLLCPVLRDGDRPNYQFATGGTMSVNAASKNPEAAAEGY